MRGENCVEASVSVIKSIAKTIDTTVIVEVAMLVRMACATCGSACDGNNSLGTKLRIAGNLSSNSERSAPQIPKVSAIASGRRRNPPRSA